MELPLQRPEEQRGVAHRLLYRVRPPASRVRDNIIHAEVEGSDHCPVELVLD
ncbi:MAG: hypothetical protein ACLRIS_06865 [Flavonifractor plautii]